MSSSQFTSTHSHSAETPRLKSKPMATLEDLPPELMTRIFTLQADGKHIVESGAFFNLRLASRRLYNNMKDSFMQRYIKCRKHMLSRHSLEVLEQLSLHFPDDVQELTIGGEHVNKYFAERMIRYSELRPAKDEVKEDWSKKFGPAHAKLVEDQSKLYKSGDAEQILVRVFKNLKNLKKVHIDKYHDEP
ncbi:hypothetical protein BDV96DRAFT_508209, partial [Lophiotrema nucula]